MITEVIFFSLKFFCNHKILITEVTSKLIQRLSSYNHRNKLTNWMTIFWNFTYNIHCFCCYVIKSAGETAKKVLLSVNLMLIEIHLYQIRIFDSKREKVCAVSPYLLLMNNFIIQCQKCLESEGNQFQHLLGWQGWVLVFLILFSYISASSFEIIIW